MFEYCSGHANAFGISIKNDDLAQFHWYANKTLENIDFNDDVYEVDFMRSAAASDIDNIIMDIGTHLDLWGQANKEPLIYITDLHLKKSDWTAIGKKKDTFKFEKNGITYIKFRCESLIEDLQEYDTVCINLIGKM